MSLTKKERDTLENHNFRVHKFSDGYVELEQWTNGGVDMIITFDSKTDTPLVALTDYLKGFDIDEEIDVYRQDEQYRNAFTHEQSVADFKDWQDTIQATIDSLKKIK